MRFTLPEPSDLENVGFTPENDIFSYKKFGKRLANLVSDVNEPLVITLDAPWGSGKTVFIKQWVGLIKRRGGKVVYFDAFADDFHGNAFLALASQIHSLATRTLNENNDPSLKTFLDATKKVGKIIAPTVLDIWLRKITGGMVNYSDIESVIKAFENESEKVVSEKIENFDEESASLEAFREALENVSKSITKGKKESSHKSPPLIFIVDELDRCRPPFALEVIERIKHLFSVENVCFVLVTNLTHLETAIRGAYGMEFDAHTYLEKFYQLKIVLPEPDFSEQNRRNKYLDYLWKNLKPEFRGQGSTEPILSEIKHLANAHALSLRQMEHVMRNVVLVAAFSREKELLDSPVTAGLCIMRQKCPELYIQARENNLSWEKVKEFLKIDGIDYRDKDNAINAWRYLTDPDASEEVIERYSRLWGPFFRNLNLYQNRRFLQRVFTSDIDNLLGSR